MNSTDNSDNTDNTGSADTDDIGSADTEHAGSAGTNSAGSADHVAHDGQTDRNDDVERIDPSAPLLTDDDLAERVALLIGRACREQLWLLFLDERAVMLPTLLPNDELPSPLDGDVAAAVAAMLRQAIAGTPIESAIFVWERPGGPIATEADRQSAAALAWACADAGVPVRAQLISHDFGVRWLGAEEFTPVVGVAAPATAERTG